MTPPSKKRTVHVALLRGINVGGKNKLPMKDLVALFEDAGCGEVRTYIQSGNVVFQATAVLAKRIPSVIAKSISQELGLDVPVITRTAEALARVVRANPFANSGREDRVLHVAFLSDRPLPKRVAALEPDRSPPDEFVVRGHEVYLSLPNGVARTKLTNAYFDAALATTSTVRNCRTTGVLLDMATRVP